MGDGGSDVGWYYCGYLLCVYRALPSICRKHTPPVHGQDPSIKIRAHLGEFGTRRLPTPHQKKIKFQRCYRVVFLWTYTNFYYTKNGLHRPGLPWWAPQQSLQLQLHRGFSRKIYSHTFCFPRTFGFPKLRFQLSGASQIIIAELQQPQIQKTFTMFSSASLNSKTLDLTTQILKPSNWRECINNLYSQ